MVVYVSKDSSAFIYRIKQCKCYTLYCDYIFKTRVSTGDGKHKIRMFILSCFATKFQYVNAFYKEVQGVLSLINILCAVKEYDTVSSW